MGRSDDGERQKPLFGGGRQHPPDVESGRSGDTDEFDERPPSATPGQMTLDPAFDYKSDRKAGRQRRTRLSLRDAIAKLDTEQRLASVAAIGMVASMFGPWWQQPSGPKLTNSGISHVSFIELAIVLVSASVLLLLYRRAEAREFHMPLADGTLAGLAGAWCIFLIVFRLFNPPLVVSQSDIGYDPHWGVFVTLGFAVLLLVAGVRGRRKYHTGESEATAADEDAIPGERH